MTFALRTQSDWPFFRQRSNRIPQCPLSSSTRRELLLGRHIFQTLDALTGNPNEGIRWCCQDNVNEREEALSAWRTSHCTILDLTALYFYCV